MILKLKPTSLIEESKSLKKRYNQINDLIDIINQKEIPEDIETTINEWIIELDKNHGTAKLFSINIRRTQTKMLSLLEKDLKMVTKHHYRNSWMAIGMTAFGLPMGVVFGSAMDNMSYIGIGLPIGMLIGIVVGDQMDKKALKEGRQLDVQIEV